MAKQATDAAPARPPIWDRWLIWRDVWFALLLPLITLIAWTTPRRWWPAIAGAAASLASLLTSGETPRRTNVLSKRFGWRKPRITKTFQGLAAENVIRLFEIMRLNRPGAAPPRIVVEGAEGPLAAVAEGRGAVMWWSPSVHRDLVAKIGLADAGLELVHISRLGHGISATRIGRAVFNPLILRIEMRYLKDRAEIDPKAPAGATLRLRKELKAGGAVGIAAAVSRHRGASDPITVKFFKGRFAFAPGAATLTLKSGAALFPVSTLREGDGYRIVIGPDISGAGKKPKRLVRAFAREIEGPVAKAPEQWAGWQQL